MNCGSDIFFLKNGRPTYIKTILPKFSKTNVKMNVKFGFLNILLFEFSVLCKVFVETID